MTVFDGVRYSLSPSLPPARRNELAAVLDLNGAASYPPYTHLIVLPASHVHNNATNDPAVKLVTDRWVDRSVVLGKCQSEEYYSPDPAMIFSGVVACATDLSVPDLEVLSAGITALGGQWRVGLTRDVTHLFALRPGSDKYNTALHFVSQTHMCILTPHWFDDAVRLGRRVPETPYTWPDPPVLRPGMTLDLHDTALATEGKRRRKLLADTEAEIGDDTNGPNEGGHVRVWAGRRILLSTSLELGVSSRGAIEAGILRAGGVVVPIDEDADEDAEAKAVDECDVFVTRWRSGKSYFKAARAHLLIGNISWLFSVESSGTLHSPLDSLLWYPIPRGGVPGLIDCEISITNYTGATRDYLKRLIELVGAKFTPSMSQSNKVLLAGFQPSPKATRALSWSIPVVNHTWLEDCLVEWRALTVGLERYIVFPPGVDFGKILMTRDAEPHLGAPPSQPVSVPRLSGGAVPGGRGVGTVDMELEEMRDAEYSAGMRGGRGPLGLSTPRENDTTADRMSTSWLEGDVHVELRARSRSRAGSVKKTPSSTARAKGISVLTPVTVTAMGAFVDHVVELPADTDDASGKQGNRSPRATPRSVSRTPSPDPFSTEVEVAMPNLGESSRSGKVKDKERGKGVGDTRKRQTRPVEEAEDIAQPAYPPKFKPHRHRPDVQTDETEVEVEKHIPAQTSKPRKRVTKGMTIGTDSDSSGTSLPPRRTPAAGSMTPVKSGMKPRLRSRPSSMWGGESEAEVKSIAAEPRADTGSRKQGERVAKTAHSGEIANKEKKRKEETEKAPSRPRLRTGSPLSTSPDVKNTRTRKRRLSVVVPPMPKEYFSSQNVRDAIEAEGEGDRAYEIERRVMDAGATSVPRSKQLEPAASIHVISAEASTSTGKRGKPHPAKSTTSQVASRNSDPQAKRKMHPSDDEDVDEEKDDMSMVVDVRSTSTGRGGPRRSAATKATTRLRENIMPDVISFEKERKQAKRRRSEDWESVASGRGEGKEALEERNAKRKKVPRDEEEEEAEVEKVVLVPSAKAKRKPMNGKGKEKGKTTVDSDQDTDDPPARNKPSGSEEKKGGRGRGKQLAVVRLMTTGVTLSDDVVKRLTKLGIQMTTKPMDCTHLVAKGVVRTEKFLCAMSVSPHVLTEEWANASAKGGKLLSENDYLLSDVVAEEKWAFKFADALARAKGPEGGPSLFKQMTFYVTPKVGVDAKLLKNVVSAGGGQIQTSTVPTVRILKGKANRYVVSCQEDKGIWWPLVQEGFKVYSPELVLRGALKQEIEWDKKECIVAG